MHTTIIPAPAWNELGLHHWVTIARRYGRRRPNRLKRDVRYLDQDGRRNFMISALNLKAFANHTRQVEDPRGIPVQINNRIVDKLLRKPERTGYVAWVPFVLRNAIEVWSHSILTKRGEERRSYYLAAIASPEPTGLVVIVGEDNVAFNIIEFDLPYASKLRVGNLAYASYDLSNRSQCPIHKCCEDIVAFEKERTVLAVALRNMRKRMRHEQAARKNIEARFVTKV